MSSMQTRNKLIRAANRKSDFSALRIGVIYTTSDLTAEGREYEQVADGELREVAEAVRAALEEGGYLAELVDLDPDRIGDLTRFDHLFNLAETIYGYPLAEYEIAAQIEDLGIPFTGAGSVALRLCGNKAITKDRLVKCGVPTPPYEVYDYDTPIVSQLRYPLFVKPVHEDGSIGITDESVVKTPAELAARVNYIHLNYFQAALVEEYIDGRDISISVLGNGDEVEAFPPSECAYPAGESIRFLTFATKWLEESCGYQTAFMRCPSELGLAVESEMKRVAVRAYRIMGCRDYARVDFRLLDDVPYVLEVNPNPCINPHGSGFINATGAKGYDYIETVNRILECSINRRKLKFTENKAILRSNVWKSA
jgi:D-alanine-D-alanine ligase